MASSRNVQRVTSAADLLTPVILTFDEEANIERTLDALRWARRVVIVDSGSTDGTRTIAERFPNVAWFERGFDSHGRQWRFALQQTEIDTPYALVLDADYAVPACFVDELETRFAAGHFSGAVAGFQYALNGVPLLGSVYPAKVVIVKPAEVEISQPGHTQELAIPGPVYRFEARLVHDDRKPLDRFLRSQLAYARLEARRLAGPSRPRLRDRLRHTGLMVPIVGVLAYLRAGGPLRGRTAVRYACERVIFECLLVIELYFRDQDRPKH